MQSAELRGGWVRGGKGRGACTALYLYISPLYIFSNNQGVFGVCIKA